MRSRPGLALGVVAFVGVFAASHDKIAAAEVTEAARPILSAALPNVPGKTLTAVLVVYPPGGKSQSHHHAGSVFAFVVSGAIRSENSATGPARVYQAGEALFEPSGSEHLVSENASATEPATLLAVFVADDAAVLATDDR